MEGRRVLARQLRHDRGRVCDLIQGPHVPKSAPPAAAAHSVVRALAQAIETSSVRPAVLWARAHVAVIGSDSAQRLLVECSRVATHEGEKLKIDLPPLIALLDQVTCHVAETLSPPSLRGCTDISPTEDAAADLLRRLKGSDEATYRHCVETSALARRLSIALGVGSKASEVVARAALLHDIGKLAIPREILARPSELTRRERHIVRQHTALGAAMLSEIPSLSPYAPIVRAHHERWDGTGYPDRLKGDKIPLEARIISIADAFHAMISLRPYRHPIAPREAIEILVADGGTRWDPRVAVSLRTLFSYRSTHGRKEATRN